MKVTFNQLIAEQIKPLLKENGFGKKGLNFYKLKDDLIFLFNFQNSQGNTAEQTKFYINCGIHSTAIDKLIDKPVMTEPKEHECYYRSRISAIANTQQDGYLISRETYIDVLGQQVIGDLKAALSLYDGIHSTSDLTNLMIDENGLSNYKELFEYLLLTDNTTDLKRFTTNLHHQFGAEKRWTIFETNLAELLKKHGRQQTIADILH